jgi:tetratricopeptide (TPR) repeat protein
MLEELILALGSGRGGVFRHVLGCSWCRSRYHYLPRPEDAPDEPEGGGLSLYGATFDRAREEARGWSAALDRERGAAPDLFVELLESPAEAREALLLQERFQTWGVFELLVERSWEVTIPDAAHAEELGLLALHLAGRLDAERYGAALIEDLRARAWAYVANACRSRSDLAGAEEAFGKAREHLGKGTGDRLESAILLDLEASLRRDQRRFGEALTMLERAVSVFLRFGDRPRAGRSLVKVATVHDYAGDPANSIPVLYQALDLIDAEEDPRLLLCAKHNLIFVLADLGRFEEAHNLYRETRALYRSFGEPWVQNRRQWVKAKIARGVGQPERAERLFLAARDGFLAEDVPYDTALVSLELATLYAEQGRAAELKRLAAEMMPVFTSRQIHREALAALAFFQQAAEAERATLHMVAEVATYLRRAQHDPGLRWEAGGRG